MKDTRGYSDAMKILILLVLVTACSSLEERQRSRSLQTEVIRTINSQGPAYAQCAKDHNLFKDSQADRIRLDVDVKINDEGQIEEFKTDTNQYPNEFLNCIYSVLDKSEFPKLKKGEVIHFKQPFIFKAP